MPLCKIASHASSDETAGHETAGHDQPVGVVPLLPQLKLHARVHRAHRW